MTNKLSINGIDETKWLAMRDLDKMLRKLRIAIGKRKTLLFAVASCRRGWDELIDERSRRAIEVAEEYAEGRASEEDRREAANNAQSAWKDAERAQNADYTDPGFVRHPLNGPVYAAYLAVWRPRAVPLALQRGAGDRFAAEAGRDQWPNDVERRRLWTQGYDREAEELCNLLREICNPFAAFDESWRTATVSRLAQGIYADRAFDELPILADALMDAGCDNEPLLTHCQLPRPHVRGCWALDLILGKE